MEDTDEIIRQEILNTRFETWRDLLRDLPNSAELDHTVVRFPNSSSYIFSTGTGSFWMMDPAYSRGDESLEELHQIADLIRERIEFIVITHLHRDHCQFELVQMLADSPVRWVVPSACAERFLAKGGISEKQLVVLAEGESCEFSGIHITACRGYHNDPIKQKDIPSASYEIELPDGIRLFFPADIRDYRIPLPDKTPVDYTFGHVFLGREDATGTEFSLLDDFCRFMTQKPSNYLILAHLYEIGRQPRDMWTSRHARMIQERMKEYAPQPRVLIPRFGDYLHLVKEPRRFQDPFWFWSKAEKEEFLSLLGVSIKKNHREWMERAIADKVPVLEWKPAEALAVSSDIRMEQLKRWREAGGRCLSIHLPDLPLCDGLENGFEEAVALALESRAMRVTVHSSRVSVGEMARRMDEITDLILRLVHPLLEAGIIIGIENLHVKPKHTLDENRPFNFIPPECIRLVKTLREKSGSKLIGVHLDIGHAYSNPPYCFQYDTARWLSECGPYLNGMHLHQFECPRTEEKPFLSGHRHIISRNAGHPSLLPVFEAWKNRRLRVPMILEVMRGMESEPFESLARLRREPFF